MSSITEKHKSEEQEACLLCIGSIYNPLILDTKVLVIHKFAEISYHNFRKETNCCGFENEWVDVLKIKGYEQCRQSTTLG
jgi:hypothetical protein